MRIDVQQLAKALTNGHHLMGICPTPLNPPKSPVCMTLGTERSMQAFHYALKGATDYWPEAGSMALIAGEVINHQGQKDWPVGAIRIEDPETLLEFSMSDEEPAPDAGAGKPGAGNNPDASTLGPSGGRASYQQRQPGRQDPLNPRR